MNTKFHDDGKPKLRLLELFVLSVIDEFSTEDADRVVFKPGVGRHDDKNPG